MASDRVWPSRQREYGGLCRARWQWPAYWLSLTDFRFIGIFRRNGEKATAALLEGVVPLSPS